MRMDKLEQRIGPGVRDAVSTDATRRRGTDATHATACRTTECGLASDAAFSAQRISFRARHSRTTCIP